MSSNILRDLLEIAGLAVATAGATLLFGPVALIGAGLGVIAVLEVTDRGPS